MNYLEIEKCSDCGAENSIIIDPEEGIKVCNKCGFVYEERIMADQDEKRTFYDDNGDNEIHRVGPPMNPNNGNDIGTSLLIVVDGKKKMIKSHTKYSKVERHHFQVQKVLSNLTENQKMIEETKIYYDRVTKNMKMQGRKTQHIIIALFYYVCRKNNCAKTFKEITNMCSGLGKIEEDDIKRAFNTIKYHLEESTLQEKSLSDIEKNYIESFIDGDVKRYELKLLAYQIVDNFNEYELIEGKSTKTIAGLSLLIACKLFNDNLSYNEEFYRKFSNKNTLKKAYKEIKNCLHLIVPQQHHEKIPMLRENKIFI